MWPMGLLFLIPDLCFQLTKEVNIWLNATFYYIFGTLCTYSLNEFHQSDIVENVKKTNPEIKTSNKKRDANAP